MVLKMGVLRFCLCTKSLPDEDDKDYDEEKADEENYLQLGDTHEEDDYLTQRVVILSADLNKGDIRCFFRY